MTLRLGLAGTQFIGNLYVDSLAKVPGVEVVAVASPNTAASFAERHRIPAHYPDHRAMLTSSDLDAVLIAAPNDVHRDICVDAAAAGKHVLCEKPLALNLAQAD